MMHDVNTVSKSDIEIIKRQLSREPRGVNKIASRCIFACPQVIETDVFIEGKRPFPTLYWLTCPAKVKALAQLEEEGWSERVQEKIEKNPAFRERLQSAHEDYIRRRKLSAPDQEHPVIRTGVGGVRDLRGVKCLHAHYAHYLATGNNPIGEMVDEKVSAVECKERCDR